MRGAVSWLVVLMMLAIALTGCRPAASTPSEGGDKAMTTFEITSPAFAQGQEMPKVHSCDGKSISPPLQWSNPPSGTRSLALIMDDPDAPRGTFVHWVVYDLPASANSLPQAVPAQPELADGTRQGNNGAGKIGYTGPCPPSGMHHYYFKLYALDAAPALAAGATKEQLLNAMQGRILEKVEMWGTYTRKQ
jgi:Raf kinase inhibitor-like YbhB/YbcL family protein